MQGPLLGSVRGSCCHVCGTRTCRRKTCCASVFYREIPNTFSGGQGISYGPCLETYPVSFGHRPWNETETWTCASGLPWNNRAFAEEI